MSGESEHKTLFVRASREPSRVAVAGSGRSATTSDVRRGHTLAAVAGSAGALTLVAAFAALLALVAWLWFGRVEPPEPPQPVLAAPTGHRNQDAVDVLESDILIHRGEGQLSTEMRQLYLTSVGQTIAGGTSEVLRTTVATRGLGLPKD